jgi:maltooligosyltrehalose trehalohydrolase
MPLIYQGAEFASSRPLIYFADHEGELGEAVRQGRMEFLAQFPGMTTDAMIQTLPHPGDPAGFEDCKLRREEDAARHEWALRLHRDLLRLRRNDPVLSRVGTGDVAIESCTPCETILLIRYRSPMGERLIVANIGTDKDSPMNDALFAPTPAHTWRTLWSSEDPAYGGAGAIPFTDDGQWVLAGNSAAILEMVSSSSGR